MSSGLSIEDLSAPTVDRAPHAEWAKAEVVVGPDGGELSTGTLAAPLELSTDWTGVLRGFGLDPDVFEIVDDTVRMSKWQTSKRTEDGDRDAMWLYSYKARFTRRAPTLTDVDFASILDKIGQYRPSASRIRPSTDDPCTYLVSLADLQIGKSAGGGIEGFRERFERAVDTSVERLAWLRKRHNIERVMVANMGDPIEGCEGNYASQLNTVKASLREMLVIAGHSFTDAITAHDADDALTVLSNHSEWMRRNGKQVTGDSDSADGYLFEQLREKFQFAEKGPSRWFIPHDEMIVMANLSGIDVAFTHGHKIPSQAREAEWLSNQSIRLLREEHVEPRIWVTAHLHHFDVRDFGPWFRFQCPSLDGGSKWYGDLTGKWSTPGLLTMLVGKHDVRGWSDVAVL